MFYYITNGSDILACNSYDDACFMAYLKNRLDKTKDAWKVRSFHRA